MFIFSEGNLFEHLYFLSHCIVYWINFRICRYIYIYIYIYTFSIKKHYFIHFYYLFSKRPKPSVSLKDLCADKNGTIMFARKRATCIESTMISSLLHGRRINFERRCRINGQRGTNVKDSFQNNNIQKFFLSVFTYHINIYINIEYVEIYTYILRSQTLGGRGCQKHDYV